MIDASSGFSPVDALPTENIHTNVIYLVPKTDEVDGYEATDGTFYVPTGTSTDPAFDHYDEDGLPISDPFDPADVQTAIDNGTYIATTVTIRVGDPQ